MSLGRASINFSDPHVVYCKNLFIKCLNESGWDQSLIWDTECGNNITYECPLIRPKGPRGQPNATSKEIPTLLLVVFILIALSSLVTNGFVCVVYSLCKEIRTAKHYFMLNLATADVLIAVLAIPFYLTEYIEDAPKWLCQIGSMIDVLCCTSSILSFAVISAERFVAVKYPLRYQTIVCRKRCIIVLSFAWIFSIAFSLAAWIPVGKIHRDHCVFFTDSYLVATTFVSFIIPLLVMLVTYGWIYNVAMYQAKQINNSIPRGLNRLKREFKAAKTLTLIIGVFVVCWLPFFCYIWVFTLYEVSVPFYELYYIVQIVRYLNSLANPLIYVSINREFRRSTFKLLRRILPYRERRASETNECTQTTEVVLRKISSTSLGANCCK